MGIVVEGELVTVTGNVLKVKAIDLPLSANDVDELHKGIVEGFHWAPILGAPNLEFVSFDLDPITGDFKLYAREKLRT